MERQEFYDFDKFDEDSMYLMGMYDVIDKRSGWLRECYVNDLICSANKLVKMAKHSEDGNCESIQQKCMRAGAQSYFFRNNSFTSGM